MKKMSYLVFVALALFAAGAVIIGFQSCNHAANAANDLQNSKGVPAVIADAKLLSYKYSLHGTTRYPLHSENVELCKDDSTRCVIRLFDESRSTDDNFDSEGEILPDSVIVGCEVLDTVKQMIIDAKAWKFKEDYSPRAQVMDGNSWHYSASFAPTDSMLAAASESQRSRMLRNGGRTLTSGGSNAFPDTKLFEQVRIYLQSVYDSEKSK